MLLTWLVRVYLNGEALDAVAYTETAGLSWQQHTTRTRQSQLTVPQFETDTAFMLSTMRAQDDPEHSGDASKLVKSMSNPTLASSKNGEVAEVAFMPKVANFRSSPAFLLVP